MMMENRKRSKADVTASTVSQPTSLTAPLPMPTLSGQNFFLSNVADNDCIGLQNNNLLLTICDEELSDESQELFCLEDSLLQIKKEEEDVTPLQYRIFNPLVGAGIDSGGNSNNTNANNTKYASTAVLPTTVQLPTGCDIYFVKEFVEKQEETSASFDADGISIGMKPDTSTHFISEERIGTYQLHSSPTTVEPCTSAMPIEAKKADYGTEVNEKRSYILETYKKRDDKRRATHNEVERRRRDKINSWIFKLKEMLPEVASSNHLNSAYKSNISSGTISTSCVPASVSHHERGNTTTAHSRTPPSDSKSQILIKACEYIRTMQEELRSLRECLSENENLRLNNQRLQNELNKLKQNESKNLNQILSSNNNDSTGIGTNTTIGVKANCTNDSFNVTLNGFNNNSCIFVANEPTTTTYAKRELIIRDYVD